MTNMEIDQLVSQLKRQSYCRGLLDGISLYFDKDEAKVEEALRKANIDIRNISDLLRQSRIDGDPGAC